MNTNFFFRGPYNSYRSEEHGEGIYFATDKNVIIMGGRDYIGPLASSTAVKSIALNSTKTKFVITYLDGSTNEIAMAGSSYSSSIADKNLTVPNAVGGIAAGTKISSLENKTYSEMFDELLFPTINPTFTEPYATISFKNYSNVQIVGSDGPTDDNFNTGYNEGAIKINGVKVAGRGGSQKTGSTESFIFVNGDSANKTLPTKVSLGNTTFNYRAAWNEGPQPTTNKGTNYGSPLPAGSDDSDSITLNGTLPWYATTSTSGVLTEQSDSLIRWNATAGTMQAGETKVGFEVKPHTAAAPQRFEIPRQATEIQMYSTVSKGFETVSILDWTKSTEKKKFGGDDYDFYIYTYSGSDRGAVKLIVKF